jgi:hypothetical protein
MQAISRCRQVCGGSYQVCRRQDPWNMIWDTEFEKAENAECDVPYAIALPLNPINLLSVLIVSSGGGATAEERADTDVISPIPYLPGPARR